MSEIIEDEVLKTEASKAFKERVWFYISFGAMLNSAGRPEEAKATYRKLTALLGKEKEDD